MQSRRLKRRAIPWSVVSVLLPTLATGWLVRELVREEDQQHQSLARVPTPSAPPQSTEAAAPEAPAEIQLVRLMSESKLDHVEARHVVQDTTGGSGARYVALRRLESLSGSSALEEAEALVLAATDDPEGRFLAANALAVLARAPAGSSALARCVERAPTDSLRLAARTLLARRTR